MCDATVEVHQFFLVRLLASRSLIKTGLKPKTDSEKNKTATTGEEKSHVARPRGVCNENNMQKKRMGLFPTTFGYEEPRQPENISDEKGRLYYRHTRQKRKN